MNQNQKNVKQFHLLFNQAAPDSPTQLDEATAKLRANLIAEEAFELFFKGLGLMLEIEDDFGNAILIDEKWLATAFKDGKVSFQQVKDMDMVELADSMGDLSYVNYGTAVATGIDMELIEENIQESNMSKSWNLEDLEEAKQLYPTAKVEHYGGNLYRLIREDGKVIKSPKYRKANLAPIIEKQIRDAKAAKDQAELGF